MQADATTRPRLDPTRFVKRVASIDPTTEDGREALLAELHAAGFPTEAARTAQPPGAAAHGLLALVRGGDDVTLFVFDRASLPEGLADALDAVDGLIHREPLDCSAYQLGALYRVLAAADAAPVETLLARIGEAREARGPDDDLGALPGEEELVALGGALAPHRLGARRRANDIDATRLDVRLKTATALADLVDR